MTSPPNPSPPDPAAVLPGQARRLGDRTFLHLPDTKLTWAETDDLVARVAGGLVERGFGDQATVMTAGGAASTQLAVWFACQRIGAVWAPLNPLLSGDPLRQIVDQARPDVIVTDPTSTPIPNISGTPELDIERLGAADPLVEPTEPLDPDRRAKLMFTSGTTGQPKGVVWSRRCEAVWADAYSRELLDVDEGDGIYTCLPLAHVTAQGTVMAALHRGATLTLADRFSPFGFWDQIRAAGARRFTFVGTILSTLARAKPRPDDQDNGVDRIVGAGAPVTRWQHIEDRFGVEIMETWGQTESAGCYTRPEHLPQRPGSIGRPTDRFEIHVDDPDGSELLLRPTERGAIFDGYLQPDGSLESPYDADGWYHTGDVVRLGHDGDLEFVTRQRESIRRRGEIIASAPIEEAAAGHRLVAEAAALAVTVDDGADEEIKLCVSTIGNQHLDPAELHRYLRGRLPSFMVPRYIEDVEVLPKTPSTRIQKFKLGQDVERAWDARRRAAKTPDQRSR